MTTNSKADKQGVIWHAYENSDMLAQAEERRRGDEGGASRHEQPRIGTGIRDFTGAQQEWEQLVRKGLVEYVRTGAQSLKSFYLPSKKDPLPYPGDLDMQRMCRQSVLKVEARLERTNRRNAGRLVRRTLSKLATAIWRDPEGKTCYLDLLERLEVALRGYAALRSACSAEYKRLARVLELYGDFDTADAVLKAAPLPPRKDPFLFEGNWELQFSRQSDIVSVEQMAPTVPAVDVVLAARETASRLAAAVEEDPAGLEFYKYLGERLVDAVFLREDTRYECSEIYLLNALLLVLCGEPDVAESLLNVTLFVLDKRERGGKSSTR